MYRNGMLSKLKDAGIELHVRSAFLQGLFFLPLHGLKDRFRDAIPHLTKLKSIASEADLTIPELSLLWLVSLVEVSRVIIGVDNMEQLKTHIKTQTLLIYSPGMIWFIYLFIIIIIYYYYYYYYY